MHLTQDQIHTITEALRRQRSACFGFRIEMDKLGHSELAKQFQRQADEAQALLPIFADAESVEVKTYHHEEQPEKEGQA
jgi:hypothetical protein